MRDKRIKLIFFSLRGSEVKDFDLRWPNILLCSTMICIILTILVGAVMGLFTNFYQNTRITSLQKTNKILKTQLGKMRKTIDKVAAQMEKIEEYDDDQRLIAGLDKIDKDMRNAGRGGPYFAFTSEANALPREIRDEVTEITVLIDQLERKIQLAIESQDEVNRELEIREDKFKRLPSIKPIEGGRISSKFGQRVDPFIEKIKPHTGIDIAAPAGTAVFVAAHGVVEVVNHHYRRNQEYGKYVVVDHGYGKQTLYAHLSRINVKPGEKVKRWAVIGAVGQTGRATGPHLHYEVRENNQPVDPFKYFFE